MLAGWGTVGIFYSIGRIAPGNARILPEGALDRLVPFDAWAVWLYLSFFALVPAAYFCAPAQRLRPLMRAMQISAILAGFVFVSWPTTLIYPAVASHTISGMALRFLAGSDSAKNCLPSLHGALTLLCMLALWQREKPVRSILVLLWGLAIMWSVIAARRHLALDLGAGIALGGTAWLAMRLLAAPAGAPMREATSTEAGAGPHPRPEPETGP
ncbi:phosphatase PAP2 family protein [Trinickia caryophylli]|nr:phosphatase PAP2 family protein [Trinickia caryophylli]PMS11155.1 inositol phosphorylceramide synthase [Trinickia caryophylli]TRX14481.1 inositol phosphorylceramide synthase [Trinickia caryophylli]WQE14320.1 phosphatase PAP2 family protein [Trinickia caryophylli]